jgi:ferredoxin
MTYILIDKSQWASGLAAAEKAYRLFGPVRQGAMVNFAALAPGQAPDLGDLNTRLSARSVVYPQSEILFEYSVDPKDPEANILRETPPPAKPAAAVGIRPCDAYSFLLVRRNFDAPGVKDVYWLRNYEATVFVGLACDQPGSTCFCTSAGCGPYSEQGLDVLLKDTGDAYLAKVLTAKGDAFMAAAGWSTEAPADSEARFTRGKEAAEARIVSTVETDRLAEIPQMALYEADFWDDIAFSCINCGTCTYLCPTCWCFDIQDEVHGTHGIRERNWDSCMFPLFTLHGSGHNPRGQKVQRVRQRFMHKLKYYVDKYGDGIQCVGCGRCIQYCPVNIDIRKVCQLMNRFGQDASCKVA